MAQREKLHRVIIETTNQCNLACSICLRQSWGEIPGHMSEAVFSKFVDDLDELSSPPEVFFGGYGEPLSHPKILDMIKRTAAIGSRISLITNGTLLTAQLIENLVDAGLHKLWLSVDSSHQDAILESRPGDNQAGVLENLAEIQSSGNGKLDVLEPGLALTITKNNQPEILDLVERGQVLGFSSFFITNLEAYSANLVDEVPYSLEGLHQPGSWRADQTDLFKKLEILSAKIPGATIEGPWTDSKIKCPFAERGDLVLRWDGETSPCLPLLYDRTIHIESWEHKQISHTLGNILDRSISEIWEDKDYSHLRERLLNNDFSPCLGCRDCWFSDDNLQDCMGFEHPTCGGCLWAGGLICCP